MFGDIQEYVRAYIDMSVSGNILFFKLEQYFKHFKLEGSISPVEGLNLTYKQKNNMVFNINNLYTIIGRDQEPGWKTNNRSTVLKCPGQIAPVDYEYDKYSTIALTDEFIFQQMTLHDEPTMLSNLCSTFYTEAKLPYDCITITNEDDNSIEQKTERLKRCTIRFLNLTELL